MRNIIRTALVIGTLATPMVAMADTPKKDAPAAKEAPKADAKEAPKTETKDAAKPVEKKDAKKDMKKDVKEPAAK
jgi:hypothetical protein